MGYQVLARKWRPHHFKDMIGQEAILRMLSNALAQQRLHHAYLFTGTRGVGKTTVARILAKCLNCEKGITPQPCDQCNACRAIDEGQFLDLYEVDAASRTKVEDTRELLENVLYPPNQGRFKIYLIDEVHMLSNHSFNALLKTLEEPPEHVKFLLATTDPKRLPITILSRCLQFHLKRVSEAQLASYLQRVCQAENIQAADQALHKLAHAADGSVRDALSLLDQAIAYGLGVVEYDNVATMLGSIAHEDLLPLLHALAAKDAGQLFAAIAHLNEQAPDYDLVLEELISLFHKVAIAQIAPNIMAFDEQSQFLLKSFTPEEVQLYYQITLLGRRDLALTPSPQQGFEMTMLRLFAFKPAALGQLHESKEPSTLNREKSNPTANAPKPSIPTHAVNVKKMPSVSSTESLSSAPSAISSSSGQTATAAKVLPEVAPNSPHVPIEAVHQEDWRLIVPKLELSGMAYALASNCSLIEITPNSVKLALALNHEPMLSQKLKERMEEALTRYLKRPVKLEITMTNAELSTPVKQQLHEEKLQLKQATLAVMENPQVKQLIEMYDATVDVSLE